MSLFTKYDEHTAPADTIGVLQAAKERYGFVPNLAAYLAESPLTLTSVLKLSEQFDQSSLSAQEQQLVLLTVSTLNSCSYCKAAHAALAKAVNMESDLLQKVIDHRPLNDSRMEALRNFTRAVVEERGWVNKQAIQKFLESGFTRAQVFEVVLGVALKTLTNYSNHLAGAEPNEEFITMAADIEIA